MTPPQARTYNNAQGPTSSYRCFWLILLRICSDTARDAILALLPTTEEQQATAESEEKLVAAYGELRQ